MSWQVFDILAGSELLIAALYTLVCCMFKGSSQELPELTNMVLTAECKDFDKAARSPSPRSP